MVTREISPSKFCLHTQQSGCVVELGWVLKRLAINDVGPPREESCEEGNNIFAHLESIKRK